MATDRYKPGDARSAASASETLDGVVPRDAASPTPGAGTAEAERQAHPSSRSAFPIVAIGASAGGIEAFRALLSALPADTGMAFVFVLHLAPSHASVLAQILGRETAMPVVQAHDEPEVRPNHVYVNPPGQSMTVRDGRLYLIPDTELPRHPIDAFFASLAQDRGHLGIGVVLSGTATDGTLGLTAIKCAGGITFAQDGSAEHDGMPRSAVSSGCVDFVLPPQQIAAELTRLARHPYVAAPPDAPVEHDEIDQILESIRQHTGVDFAQYKTSTLHRRIRRRMALHKFAAFGHYAAYLRQHTDEMEALYQDILISVTNFFRNPESFEALKSEVFPHLFEGRSRQDPVRVWVLGCSTGEEAYSLAIVLAEYVADTHGSVPVALYATDLNYASIERSRTGLYPRSIAEDVSPERLRRFFVEVDGGYRVAKSIRDMCIFARQNVLTDPPFSRMDLVSCRNVMIYMESALQRRLLLTFHYALKPEGFLFLGPSETIGSSQELFEARDVKHKIFLKRAAQLRPEQAFPIAPYTPLAQGQRPERWVEGAKDAQAEIQREADRVLQMRYLPPGVLINAEYEVVQFRGDTGLYLTPAPGKASLNVLKMAREGLLVSLRSLLQRANKEDGIAKAPGVRVRSNGGYRNVCLSVLPVRRSGSQERWYWVLFEEPRPADPHGLPGAELRGDTARSRKAQSRALQEKDDQIARLTQELAATREYLQSVIEQQEAANEELQSANEEVQSANEELQSINEELETSKEEIQSSNEELRTVNEELHNRNEELSRLNDDLNNLLSSVEIAIVMVWQDLRIRRFTPLAEKHFNLIASDVGRPIGDIKLNLEVPDLPQLLTEVIDTVAIREMEVRDRHGRWYLLRIRPYRTLENKIDGAVIVLIDIQALKANQEALERQGKLLEQTHEAIFARELSGEILYWNHGAELLYGYSKSEALGRKDQELLGTEPAERKRVIDSLATSNQWEGELDQRHRSGRAIVVYSRQVVVHEGKRALVLETNHDVTERRRLEASLQQRVEELALTDQRKNEFLALLAHELRNPLAPMRNAVHILGRAGDMNETAAHARELMERQLSHMTRLVDDLLDAARINRGQVQLQLESAELQPIISRAIESTQPLIAERKHRIMVQMPPAPIRIEGDPTRLEQIFSNLITNAAKYTPEAGEIHIGAELREEPDAAGRHLRREAVIRIRDSGIGIEPHMLPRVFELFTQADQSLGRARGGLGIGLSVVRSLVELHGGRVTARSDGIGHGSEFTVVLPAAPDASGARNSERDMHSTSDRTTTSSSEPDRSATRVLVVDDNPDIVESTSIILQLAGYTVKSALSGEAALDVAPSFQPAVVLLDIGMPGLDGYAVARRIRDEPKLKDAVLIAVSGYGTAADRARTREAGFDRHLVKPVDPMTLQRMLIELAPASLPG
jgi:two-component system, chemotaxis family, CheB/CheR fusion protein